MTKQGNSFALGAFVMTVLEAMAVFLVVYMIVAFSGVLKSSDKGTQVAMSQFVSEARAVIDGQKETGRVARYYVADGYVQYAFDAGVQTMYDTCRQETVLRPARCGTGSCFCICAEGSRCQRAVSCVSFPDIASVHVVSTVNADAIKGRAKPDGTGKDFVVYGDCGAGDGNFKVTPMYVTKVNKNLLVSFGAPVDAVAT